VLLVLLTVTTVVLLTGCAAPNIDKFSGVTARLDTETSAIGYPLDDYVLVGREAQKIEQANELLSSRCVAKFGFTAPITNWAEHLDIPNRQYGIWTMKQAINWGYALPINSTMEQEKVTFSAAIDKISDEIFRECYSKLETLPSMRPHSSRPDQPSIVDRGYIDAWNQAKGNAEWRAIGEKWVACIAQQHLKPSSGDGLMPQFSQNDLEVQMKIALIDVGCKVSLGTVQQSADIESRYQAAYIEAN